MTSPASVPLHLLALQQAAQPGTFTDLAVGGDTAARVTSDAQLRAAIVNVAGYYVRLAKTRTPAQMEALIWDNTSSDGADHGESCAAFASLTLELAAQAVGQQSWVTGGETYPWPLPEWADARVDTNAASPQITSVVADAQAHGRWHPLGDGYQPQPGDWALYDGHVEVVTSYAGGVLDTIGADSLPGLTVNAHSSAAPLAEQGVAGFIDNGNLKAAGGAVASSAPAASTAAPATAAPSTPAAQPHAGKSGTGSRTPAAAVAPAGATAAIPGIPAASAAAGPGGGDGGGTNGGTAAAAKKADGHGTAPAAKKAAGQGQPASASIPGVLATGDLLGGTAQQVSAPASGHGGAGRAGAASGTAIPGLAGSSAGTGSVAIPGAMPAPGPSGTTPAAHAAAAPTATPAAPRPAASAGARPSSPAAAPRTSPSTGTGASAGQHYTTPGTRGQQAFISLVAPGAIAAQQRFGVPAAVTIAQAIEESAWGQSGLAAQYHNLFGIKGTGPAGSVSLPTSEFQGGQWVTIDAQFRVYHNDAESIADHAELLATSGYYTRAMADRAVPDAFANDLTGVYATDPGYGANLIALMKLYHLYQFDSAGTPAPTLSPTATPTASPTVTPTASPTVSPTATPSGNVAASPAPTATGAAPTPSTPAATPAPTVSGTPGSSSATAGQIPGLVSPGQLAPAGATPAPSAPAAPPPATSATATRGAGQGRGTGTATAPRRGAAQVPGVVTSAGIVTTARFARARVATGPARYQAQLPHAVTTALFASAKAPLARGEHLYRDVAACTGVGWELLAAADWMQCKADPRYSPVHGEKIGSLNDDGTTYPTKSAALIQCAGDLIELTGAVYGIDLTARRRLSVRELAAAFAAFRWGAILRRHAVSPMEFPYSVAGLTAQHQKMHWPPIDAPDAPDRPGTRFRPPFGAVPVVLSLDYPATVLRQEGQVSPCSASRYGSHADWVLATSPRAGRPAAPPTSPRTPSRRHPPSS
jgi:flagellum-specific peptidoglycan hydrolase FlgJ